MRQLWAPAFNTSLTMNFWLGRTRTRRGEWDRRPTFRRRRCSPNVFGISSWESVTTGASLASTPHETRNLHNSKVSATSLRAFTTRRSTVPGFQSRVREAAVAPLTTSITESGRAFRRLLKLAWSRSNAMTLDWFGIGNSCIWLSMIGSRPWDVFLNLPRLRLLAPPGQSTITIMAQRTDRMSLPATRTAESKGIVAQPMAFWYSLPSATEDPFLSPCPSDYRCGAPTRNWERSTLP